VPNETFFPSAPQSRVQELVQQGKQLRTKGDTQAAITRFREAQVIEPANPESTAELALTYEKMGLAERAGEQWRRIIALGEAAGPYLMTANAKMDMAKLEMLRNQPTSASGTLPSVPGGTSDSGLTSGNTAALIPEGKTLGVGDPSLVEGNDPGLSKKLTLSLPLLARPGRTVQVNQVVAQVLFYDTVNGKDPVKTAANVRYRWGSPPADWANGRDEVLEVDYELPKPDPRDPRAQKRKYLGYIVRLYYRGELQDSRADPRTLGTQFPPPRLLNPE
jgi:tetratricopeptide (TPR) repeat protein